MKRLTIITALAILLTGCARSRDSRTGPEQFRELAGQLPGNTPLGWILAPREENPSDASPQHEGMMLLSTCPYREWVDDVVRHGGARMDMCFYRFALFDSEKRDWYATNRSMIPERHFPTREAAMKFAEGSWAR